MIRKGFQGFFILFTCSIYAFAQNDFRQGWVVLSNGDTLQGLVQYQISNKVAGQCKYKFSGSDEVQVYSPNQLKSFGYKGGKVFLTKDTALNVSSVFMENIIRGDAASLYRYGRTFYVEKDSLYKLELVVNEVVDQNVLYEQKKKKFSGLLNFLIADCGSAELSKGVMEADYNEPDFARVISDYNRCRKSAFVDFKKGQKSIDLNYYVIAGIANNKFSYQKGIYPFRTDEDVELRSFTPVFGLGLNVRTPRFTENISFNLEVQISNYGFSQSIKRQESNHFLSETYDLSYFRVKIPIGIKVDLSSSPRSAYLRAGGGFNLYSNGRIRATQAKDFQNSPDTIISDDSELDGFRMSQLFFGAGLQFSVSQTLKGFVELRGEAFGGGANQAIRVDDVVVIESRSMNSQTLNLIFGLAF